MGRFASGLAVLLAIFLGAAFIPREASATEDPGRVEVVLGGPTDAAAAMRAILQELLGRLAVEVQYQEVDHVDLHEVLTPKPNATPATARVWLELGATDRATVYLADDEWERILVRNLPLPDGLDEVGREQLGHIVETSVEALLEGGRIGITRVEAMEQLGVPSKQDAPAPVPEFRPAPDPGPWPGVWVALGYQTQFWGGPVPAYHGPVAMAGIVGGRIRSRPGAFVSAQYLTPASIETDLLGLGLQGGAFRLMAALSPKVADNLALHTALGGGVDVIAVAPSRVENGLAAPSRRYVAAFAQAQAELGLSVSLPRGFALGFSALLGVDLIDGFFFVEGVDNALFDPWVPRPGLRLSLAWGSREARFLAAEHSI